MVETEAETYFVVTYDDDGRIETVPRKRIVAVGNVTIGGTYMVRWIGSKKYSAKILFTGKTE